MKKTLGKQSEIGAQGFLGGRREPILRLEPIGELELLRDELASARMRLERMSKRSNKISIFTRRAIVTESRAKLARLVSEYVVEILNCEIGMVWYPSSDNDRGNLYVSPGHELQTITLDKISRRLAHWRENSSEISPPTFPSCLGLRAFLVEPLRDSANSLTGILLAANPHNACDLRAPFDEFAIHSFTDFAKQVGAMMESRLKRELTLAQIEKGRVSDQMIPLAIEAGEVGLWDWDFETNRLIYSEQSQHQLGHAGDEIFESPRELLARLHPEDRKAAIKRAIECYRSNDFTYENIFRLRHRDCGWRWILTRGAIIRDVECKPRRAAGIHIDITNHKKLEEELRAAKNEAERTSRAKSEFVAKVSHEIRNPLNGIVGVFQLLKSASLSEEQKKVVALGESASRWMMEVIGKNLDLARIEAGKLELSLSPFDPRRLLEDIMFIESNNTASKGLRIRQHVAHAVPEGLIGDAPRIRQILTNLIGNAIKFTERGTVTVRMDMGRRRRGSRRPLVISVTDTGPGIPPELTGNIFQPFEQVPCAANRRTEGIGLGLAIARELVGLMGGAIRIRSRLGKGTRFEVRIPLEASPASALNGSAIVGSPARYRGRVLLVEDEPICRELEAMMLRRQGLEVDTAENGRIGLGRLLAEKFDLAVVDCWMPELDGLEMTRQLRKQGRGWRQKLPVIALTASTQCSDISACRNAGMDDHLSKPLLEEDLRLCIDQFLPRG